MKLQYFISKINKKRFYDPVSYFLSNFMFFFSKEFKHNLQNKQRLSYFYGKLRKRYLKKNSKMSIKKPEKNEYTPNYFIYHAIRSKIRYHFV